MLFNDRRKSLGQLSYTHAVMSHHSTGQDAGSPTGSYNQKFSKNALATETGQKGSAKRIAKGRKKDRKAGM